MTDILSFVHLLSGINLFVFAISIFMNGMDIALTYEIRDKSDVFHAAWYALRFQAFVFLALLTTFIATMRVMP